MRVGAGVVGAPEVGGHVARPDGVPSVGRPERMVPRTALVARIRADPGPIVVVEAPAGSGKTTLLAEWVRTDPRPTAWLTVTGAHSDPIHLLSALVDVLASIHPHGPLADGRRPIKGADPLRGLARLSRALHAEPEPTLLVIDDVHLLADQQTIDLVTSLADRFPTTGRIALAGRTDIGLPIARWQLAGKVLVVDRQSLDLVPEECERLLRVLGVREPGRLAPEVVRRTEGWAAGAHLLGLWHSAHPDRGLDGFGGDGTRLVETYLRSELLDRIDPRTRAVLVRTSVADVVSGPLADAVSDEPDAARRLAEVAHGGLLVTSVDASNESFRFHSLLRDVLLRELAADPVTELEVRLRVSAWYEAAGMADQAIEHALGAGDLDRAARLTLDVAQTKHRVGEAASLQHWLGAFDEPAMRARPGLAALAALFAALEGDATSASQWASIMVGTSMPSSGPASSPGTSLVSAVLCERGPEAMRREAIEALDEHDEHWRYRTSAVFAAGMAELMLGRADQAVSRFGEVERIRGVAEAAVRLLSRAERAMAEMSQHRWREAQSILDLDRQAVLADPDSARISGLPWLVADARLAMHRGDTTAALERLRRVEVGRVRLTWAIPWLAIRTLTGLARVELQLGNGAGARATLGQARDILAVRPMLGCLVEEMESASQQALAAAHGDHGWSTLTPAELRLLPLLQTYLTIKEIGTRLGVSPNTAKTHALSIYGKLGASTRSEAVESAVARGLLEDLLAHRG